MSAAPVHTLNVSVAVIGAGPAGLMAAEVLSQAGVSVDVFDAMPSVGRKLLLAGKGGLNMTHAEAFEPFVSRYAERSGEVGAWLSQWGPEAVRQWAAGLGVETFVGSSQRVFPTDMKAAPLLRSWLQRLRHPAPGKGVVRFHMRHRCTDWDSQGEQGLWHFQTPQGPLQVAARWTVLALGGGSWARLGSDGAWQTWVARRGVQVSPLRAANCGFDVAGSSAHSGLGWSPLFMQRFAGQPIKTVVMHAPTPSGHTVSRRGECVLTQTGLEGSLVYALAPGVRETIALQGEATVYLDLLPDWSEERVFKEVAHPRGSRSWSSHLKSRLRIEGAKLGLVYECVSARDRESPLALSRAIKRLPLRLARPRPLDEAISSAGGVRLESLTARLMSLQHPGVFFAGEMLDWEAPTGGYLLTAAWASGVVAAQGVLDHQMNFAHKHSD